MTGNNRFVCLGAPVAPKTAFDKWVHPTLSLSQKPGLQDTGLADQGHPLRHPTDVRSPRLRSVLVTVTGSFDTGCPEQDTNHVTMEQTICFCGPHARRSGNHLAARGQQNSFPYRRILLRMCGLIWRTCLSQ